MQHTLLAANAAASVGEIACILALRFDQFLCHYFAKRSCSADGCWPRSQDNPTCWSRSLSPLWCPSTI